VPDGGRCRFPGCRHRHVDIHHLRVWEHGGPSDIENGLLACPRHHTMLPEGVTATGEANHTVTFDRSDGSPLGTSRPRVPVRGGTIGDGLEQQ
jgi:predicted restriction endonuclease